MGGGDIIRIKPAIDHPWNTYYTKLNRKKKEETVLLP